MKERHKVRVVIAGGGVAALEAMVALRTLAEERVDLTLVAPDDVFAYRPLAVVEPFGLGKVARFSLRVLAARCGARYEQGAVVLATPEQHSIYTSAGRTLDYDALLLASGARASDAVPGAVTFGGPAGKRAIEMLLEDLGHSLVRRVVFAAPTAVSWTLPLYELALLVAERVADQRLDALLTLATPEEGPLAVFGQEASSSMSALLQDRGIVFHASVSPKKFAEGRLELVGGSSIPADWVLTLPRLTGRIVDGIPHDQDGFVRTDSFGRVQGLEDVFAVGDMTTFPIKQGGIAAQQADAAAEAIAADAGANLDPKPFEPVLRGLLLTGERPTFLRTDLVAARSDRFTTDQNPLWWPAGKIAAHHLSPYLAEHASSLSAA